MSTPIKKDFNFKEYGRGDAHKILKKMLIEKMALVNIYGSKIDEKNLENSLRYCSITISEEDMESFMHSEKFKKECENLYKESFKLKKEKYEKLKEKLDYCLHDVKPYRKLIENIGEFTYCGAISELEDLEKRYLKSKGYTKAVYRGRLQQFSKVDC